MPTLTVSILRTHCTHSSIFCNGTSNSGRRLVSLPAAELLRDLEVAAAIVNHPASGGRASAAEMDGQQRDWRRGASRCWKTCGEGRDSGRRIFNRNNGKLQPVLTQLQSVFPV